MALATYSDLQASVANWLERADLSLVIPDFIALAEGYLATDTRLRIRQAEAVVTLVSNADGLCDLPADYAATRDIYPESETSSVTGFEVTGTTIQLDPISAGENIVLHYYRTPTALSGANPTNWLLTAAPVVYLYATLLQAAPYLGHDPRLQTWANLLEQALDQIRSSDRVARYSRAVIYVNGPTP
jgi:hypothetical protein